MADKPDKNPAFTEGLVYLSMGTELVITVLFGWFIGSYLDEKFSCSPVILLSLIIGGFIAWVFHLLRMTRKFFRNPK